MLTRLLGEEAAALSSTEPNPFTGVAAGDPSRYTAYAYAKGCTTGVSADSFHPGGVIGSRSV